MDETDVTRCERWTRRGLYRVVSTTRGVCGDLLPPQPSEPMLFADALAQFDRRVATGGYRAGTGARLAVMDEAAWAMASHAALVAAGGGRSVLGGVR